MSKKPKAIRHPLNEGHIAEIDQLFFRPLMKYKPEALTISEWYEYLFDFKSRDIGRYKVKRKFKMPGLYCAAPLLRIQGIGDRLLQVKDVVFVRQDARDPAFVDVETVGRKGRPDALYRLTDIEWTRIQQHLEPAERKTKK